MMSSMVAKMAALAVVMLASVPQAYAVCSPGQMGESIPESASQRHPECNTHTPYSRRYRVCRS